MAASNPFYVIESTTGRYLGKDEKNDTDSIYQAKQYHDQEMAQAVYNFLELSPDAWSVEEHIFQD